MMDDFPPELRARRAEIRDTVMRRGRTLRRRRAAAMVAAVVVVVAIPAAAIALTVGSDHHARIAISAPPTTETSTESSTVATTSTSEPTTATSSSILGSTATSTTGAPPTSTSTLVCHNSTNPACGPLHYGSPITNQGATLEIVKISPARPTLGQTVTFTLRAVDPDSRFVLAGIWCDNSGYSFGDNSLGYACAVTCAVVNEYGPWDPPPAQPSDLTFTMAHAYTAAGTFHAKFGVTAEACGPRTSMASADVTVTIAATTPTS
jgi:hypothetical protein